MTNKAIIKGSLSAVAKKNNVSLAESFMGADVLILVDQSSSMSTPDAPDGLSRYQAAENDVIRLQEKYEGRIAVLSFGYDVQFNPNGKPNRSGGNTDMVKALQYIKPCDDTGMKLILISDGQPDNAEKTLAIAKTFKTPIETIYIGSELGSGRKFLQKLASLTGGSFSKSASPGLLADSVEVHLLTG